MMIENICKRAGMCRDMHRTRISRIAGMATERPSRERRRDESVVVSGVKRTRTSVALMRRSAQCPSCMVEVFCASEGKLWSDDTLKQIYRRVCTKCWYRAASNRARWRGETA